MARRSAESLMELTDIRHVKKAKGKLAASRSKLEELMNQAHDLKKIFDDAEKRLNETKKQIIDLVQTNNLVGGSKLGYRVGERCAIVRYNNGKTYLSQEKLIENGVKPSVIEKSKVEGNGYWSCELPVIGGKEKE